MNWSAKLFLSVLCLVLGCAGFVAWLYLVPLYFGLFVTGIPCCFLLGLILGLISIRYDEHDTTLAKTITLLNGLALLGIAYLYYDFAVNFSFWN
jgi:hypothetical protein